MAGGPPKNWHWRTKDCRVWAKEWFSQNALVSADGVKIDEVKDIVGDCELGMRKSKFVHIYDLSIDFTWSAGDDVAGTLRAIEVSHDMEESEYQFEGALTSGSGTQAEKYLVIARKQLADKLRPVFQTFPTVMVEVHGKDIFEDNGTSAPTSGTHTPSTTISSSAVGASSTSSSAPAPAATAAKSGKAQNTATVRLESQFMVSASDLWDILTNDKRIPDWSRNAVKFKLVEDSDFELFGGNVSGKIVSFNAPTELVQRWTAPNWNGHFGTLTTTLSQGSDSTKLTLTLSGVPVGKEDETERNLDGFYLRALKQIGLGALL